ncbi:MAG: ABC transporter ATP-binding protein [Thermoplasmata archaeon]
MSSSEPLLRVERLCAAWGEEPVLRDVSFDLSTGELLSLLGPNGSGKTTLLRCLVGLERPTSGSIRLDGMEIGGLPTHRRGVGLMSQEPALFPNRTVLENVAYAPLLRRTSDQGVRDEVRRWLVLLRLEAFEDRRPDTLSGGERQRVALARALAAQPKVILLDEPFASIDVELRADLRAEFRRVLRELGIAAIHVTHDREEGLFLGDRVGLLFAGRLETIGTPADVFAHPPSVRAARLLGYNVLREGDGARAVHPSDVRIGPRSTEGREATVVVVGTTGRERLVVLSLADGERVEARGMSPEPAPRPGDVVGISWVVSIRLSHDHDPPSVPAAGAKEPKWTGRLGRP